MALNNEYNLNVIKEVTVTDSFLSMDKDVRGCQAGETHDSCVTANYIEAIKNKCRCLPLSLRLSKEVGRPHGILFNYLIVR